MKQISWMLVAVLEKRQSVTFSLRIGPNDETILVINGEDVVFLTGNNARCLPVQAGQILQYDTAGNLLELSFSIGPFIEIEEYRILSATSSTVVLTTFGNFAPIAIGPGTLYLSDGLAFFSANEMLNIEINEAKATAIPLRTQVQVRRRVSDGRPMAVLDVNSGNFTMTLTGAATKILGITSDQRILYTDRTLIVEQGVLQRTEYRGIIIFAVLRVPPGTSDPQYNVFTITTTEVIQGPGQVYVSVGENRAFFVEDFSFRSGGRDVIESINRPIFDIAFSLEDTGETVIVRDSLNNPIVTLSINTTKFDLSDAAEVSYIGSEQTLTFLDQGGRVNTFYGILMFAIFDNNTLQTFTSSSGTTILLCTGGTVVIDSSNRTALFTSNSNPIVISELCEAIPSFLGISYAYEIIENGDKVRFLTVKRRNITTTPATEGKPTTIQTVTGLYVAPVRAAESVTFRNNEIVIQDSVGNTVKRIGEVDQLFVNTITYPFNSFIEVAPIPFLGRGTLTYSRGTAFFTTNRTLGTALSFQSVTAPIPDIDFERVTVGFNIVDGVNYTVSSVIQTIGGDRVVTYEATSYTTTSDQEILYSGDLVTVTRPIRTREGTVIYSGSEQTVTYTNRTGNRITIAGVDTFYDFSGGDVRTTTSPDSITLRGPGKLYYVSDDRSDVLFSTSNIVTSRVAGIIRQGVIEFSVSADQFSSIFTGVFNVSTNSSTVTYPGGGVIWFSLTLNGTRESLYVDDGRVSSRIHQAVRTILTLTKSAPAKNQGIIRTIFNGRDLYSYAPIIGNRDILIRRGSSFTFNGTSLTADILPGGPYTGINRVITFDSIEVKEFNSSVTPVEFEGFGMLLVQSDSDTAFYITSLPTVTYLLQSITNLEQFLIPPQIQPPTNDRIRIKLRAAAVQFGTDVRSFVGAEITFICNIARGRPQPNVTFFRTLEDGDCRLLSDMQMGITIENNTLTIASIAINDTGEYKCRADNNVPPVAEEASTLTVKAAATPRIRPGWLPFEIRNRQRMFWPRDPSVTNSFEVQVVKELVFPCRVEGRPKSEVAWQFNGMDIETVLGLDLLQESSANITEVSQGRSVLIINVEVNQDVLSGENVIECSAANAGGSTSGSVILQGISYNCILFGVGECSITCGFGISEVIYTCTREQVGMPPQTVSVSEVPEEVLPLLDRTRVCSASDAVGNFVICPITEYRWNTSEWSECTRSCGGGSRTRLVTCLNISIPINSTYIAQLDSTIETEVNETMCWMFEPAGWKPRSRELCNKETCPIWQTTEEYSECSVTCGIGVQERTVTCNIITGNYTDENGNMQFNLTVVPDSQCNQDRRPRASKECHMIRCFYQWLPGAFGQCGDVPLPDEFRFCRQRGFVCYNGDPNPRITERVINDSFCADVQPGTSLGSCNGGRCFNGIWEALGWSACSASCGYGTHTRVVQCLSPVTLTLVHTDFCDSATMPPPQEQCFMRNCRSRCLRDEISLCPTLAKLDLCDSAFAMGDNGLRCCDTCLGLAEDEDD